MARVLGFLLFLAVVVYVIAATSLFVLALVLTVAIVKHVSTRHRVAPAAKLQHHAPAVPSPAPAPVPAYLSRWSVQRRSVVASDKDDWDQAFRDAELRAQVCAAGSVAYRA